MPVMFDGKVDPRSGTIERSSSCSKKLLSVLDCGVQHHMLHARQAHWQSPVTRRSRGSIAGDASFGLAVRLLRLLSATTSR